MSELDELMSHIPISDLAAHLGVDEQTAQQAVSQALPALVGGLQSNAADPEGAASLQGALQQHSASLLDGGVDLGGLDLDDGAKILGHIFGGDTDQVHQQVAAGIQGGSTDAAGLAGGMGKLLPMLAPIVLSFLTKKLTTGSSTESAGSSGGGLENILGSILGGLGR